MIARRVAILACCVALFGACTNSLVDERYARVGEESINGLDAFMELLHEQVVEQLGGEILQASSLTRRVRAEADLVIYFERDFVADYQAEDYYRNFEAYLFGLDPEDLESVESVAPDADLPDESFPEQGEEFELEDESEPVEIRFDANAPDPRLALQEEANAGEDGVDFAESPELSGDSDESEDEIAPDRYKTILYFMKDTDASVAFWERLADQMRDHPREHAYCKEQLQAAILARSLDTLSYQAPLSSRRTVHEGGRLVEELRWNRSVFPEAEFPSGGLRYPVRAVPGEAFSHFGLADEEDLGRRSLLSTIEGGHDLIRELDLPFARLIIVYNSESFLNHSQVHAGNRRLARALLRYGLAEAEAGAEGRPVAAVVRAISKTETAAREDFDMLRFLKVFPLNVIVIHFFALLLLYLYSRWPHTGPPLENRSAGNREFLEHIRAIGARLSRTTPRMKALEPLLRYKQKTTGRDYTAVIEKLDEVTKRSERSTTGSGGASRNT